MTRSQGMKNPTNLSKGTVSPKKTNGKTSRKKSRTELLHTKQSIPQKLRRIQSTPKQVITYVLDTNVIMGAWDSLFKFEEHEVCITGQVWKELDAHKKGHSAEAWNVRQAIRAVDKLLAGKTSAEIKAGVQLIPPAEIRNGKPHTGKLILNFTKPKLPDNFDLDLDLEHPDDRIIAVCLALKATGKRVVLVSNDGSCRIKAGMVGIEAEEYLGDTVTTINSDENLCPGFHCVPDDFLERCTDVTVKENGVSSYTLKHPTLADVMCNEFLTSGDMRPLRIVSKTASDTVTAETFSYLDDINAMGVIAKNEGQAMALQLLYEPSISAVSLAGRAGSGKTYLALSAGIKQVEMGIFKRILFTRTMIGSDEDIGFLPGDEKEKLSPWMGALWDNLESLRERSDNGGKKKNGDVAIEKLIQIKALNFMKGRSITDTYIIVDEVQDLTTKKLKMICTRVGEGSKIVFLGNVAQIDDPYLTEHTSGLSVFIRSFRDSYITGHITLQDGERSAFATLAEERL